MHLPRRTIFYRVLIGAIALGAVASLIVVAAQPPSGRALDIDGQDFSLTLDRRFTPLKDVLPRRGVIGYATTQPVTAQNFAVLSRHRYAQYVLAPLVIGRNDNPRITLLVADFPDVPSLAEYRQRHEGQFRVVYESHDGLAVLERSRP
jgi:hypothetical protein